MAIFMGVWDTVQQNINHIEQELTQRTRDFIHHRWLVLVGAIKLAYILDRQIALQDNHLLDSGFLRLLYLYRQDDEIGRYLRNFKNLMEETSQHIFYIYDNRIKGVSDAKNLIQERVNLTLQKNKEFLHSAAFKNENNWKDIDDYASLVKTHKEYDIIFGELSNLLSGIQTTNIIKNPQKQDSFGKSLNNLFEKEESWWQDGIRNTLNDYFVKIPNLGEQNRSNLMKFAQKRLPDKYGAFNQVITHRVYNHMIPDIEPLFAPFSEVNMGHQKKAELIFAKEFVEHNTESQEQQVVSLEKGRRYELVAKLDLQTIKDIQKDIGEKLLSLGPNPTEKDKKRIRKEVLNKIFIKSNLSVPGEPISISVPLSKNGHTSINVPLSINIFGESVPINRITLSKYMWFLCVSSHKRAWKELGKEIDGILSPDTKEKT